MRLIDAEVERFGVGDLPDLLAWATRLGYDGLNVTHPFKQAIVPLLDDVSDDAADLGAVNTVVIRDGRLTGHNTDWSGWGRAFRQALPERVRDPVLVLGAGGAGAAVGYALLEQGAQHVAVHDPDEERAHDCVTRLAKRYGDDRVERVVDVASALREADGLVNATPVGMLGHDGVPLPEQLLREDLWVADVVYFPLRTRLLELCGRARSSRARGRRHGRLPGGRRLRVLHRGRARRRPHVRALRRAHGVTAPTPTILETRPDAGRITTGIATVSLSGLLADKLDAIAGAGFDGVEIFDNDLVASPLPPAEVAMRCADLGLTIDLFQPVRDVQGVPPERFPAVLHRVRTKLEVMAELGATRVLACSSVAADSSPDIDQTAEQLHAVGALAAEYGGTVAFEALAWGRHVNRVGQAWEAVVRADHPAVTLAVDTFHMLARGDDGAALAGIPGDRIGFLQVADAPLLDMGLLEWSRHHRCFPGQGTLDVPGVVAAALTAGYRGPVSLEVFSDVVRQVDPDVTARDAKRSLVFLEDLLSRRLPARERSLVHAAPPASSRTDAAFVEIADPRRLGRGAGRTARVRPRGHPPLEAGRPVGQRRGPPGAQPRPRRGDRDDRPRDRRRSRDRRRCPSPDPAVAGGRPHPRRRRGAVARGHAAGGSAPVRQRRARAGGRLAHGLRG